MRRHPTLLVVVEVHHLPGLPDYEPGTEVDPAAPDEASSWSRALLPMVNCASYRLLLSGTLVEKTCGRHPTLSSAIGAKLKTDLKTTSKAGPARFA